MNFTDVWLDRILQALLNPLAQIREVRDALSAASASTANSQVCMSPSRATKIVSYQEGDNTPKADSLQSMMGITNEPVCR